MLILCSGFRPDWSMAASRKGSGEWGSNMIRRRGLRFVGGSTGGLAVDAMPTDQAILGFSNPWYQDALSKSTTHMLPSGRTVHILTPPYFLATKLEAFQSRGGTEIRLSSDLEDVVYLLDNRPGLTKEVEESDSDVKAFIQTTLHGLLGNPSLPEAVEAALGFGSARERAKAVQAVMRSLARGE